MNRKKLLEEIGSGDLGKVWIIILLMWIFAGCVVYYIGYLLLIVTITGVVSYMLLIKTGIKGIKIGKEYRHIDDFGGKWSDGSERKPLKYIPTEIKNGRVFYDVVSPDSGFIRGNSSSTFAFWTCYTDYE